MAASHLCGLGFNSLCSYKAGRPGSSKYVLGRQMSLVAFNSLHPITVLASCLFGRDKKPSSISSSGINVNMFNVDFFSGLCH